MTTVDYLPDSVLSYIFSYLNPKTLLQLERVTKRFQLVAKASWSHVRRLDIEKVFDFPPKPDDQLGLKPLMLRSGHHLQEIVSNSCFVFPVSELIGIGQFCPKVRIFRFRWPVFVCEVVPKIDSPGSGSVFGPDSDSRSDSDYLELLGKFFGGFPALEELSLVCPHAGIPIPVHVNFLLQIKLLKRLQLCDANLTTETFPMLCSQLANTLECLILWDRFPSLSHETFLDGLRRLVNLKELTLRHIRLGSDSSYLTESVITSSLVTCQNLELIFLTRVQQLGSRGLEVVSQMKNLRALVLLNCGARGHLDSLCCRSTELTHVLHVFVRDNDVGRTDSEGCEPGFFADPIMDLRPYNVVVQLHNRFDEFLQLVLERGSWLYRDYWNMRMFVENMTYNPKCGGSDELEEILRS